MVLVPVYISILQRTISIHERDYFCDKRNQSPKANTVTGPTLTVLEWMTVFKHRQANKMIWTGEDGAQK